MIKQYPAIDGSLHSTKDARDAHNATIKPASEFIHLQPYSAVREFNESIRNGAA